MCQLEVVADIMAEVGELTTVVGEEVQYLVSVWRLDCNLCCCWFCRLVFGFWGQ